MFSTLKTLTKMPLLLMVLGWMVSMVFGIIDIEGVDSATVSTLAMSGLAALVFSAGLQFRLSHLAQHCPVSFRLCFGGAPLFLLSCGLTAFILIPQLSLPTAMLLGGILMLNGSAFDRRSVMNAPTPALVKAGVRFESAVILALGLPLVMLLQGNATQATQGDTVLAPLLIMSMRTAGEFAIGGGLGLIAAFVSNHIEKKPSVLTAIIAALIAVAVVVSLGGSGVLGGIGVIAAGAAGLIWGEQSRASAMQRMRYRVHTENVVMPLTFFGFGFVLAPRLFEADLLMLTFAIAVVTIMRAAPRLAALQTSALPREAQVFLAWFGGTPGAASALFLLAIVDNSAIADHEMILTVGTVCVLIGVLTSRLTAKPLAKGYIRGMAKARQRAMLRT